MPPQLKLLPGLVPASQSGWGCLPARRWREKGIISEQEMLNYAEKMKGTGHPSPEGIAMDATEELQRGGCCHQLLPRAPLAAAAQTSAHQHQQTSLQTRAGVEALRV